MMGTFSKSLGKILLMTAAALLVACGDSSGSSGPEGGESSSPDTTKITYALKPFDGPLSNPHSDAVPASEANLAVESGEANLATQPGGTVALTLFENEDAYKSGKNPTVRFDNDGLQENNKLLLKSR